MATVYFEIKCRIGAYAGYAVYIIVAKKIGQSLGKYKILAFVWLTYLLNICNLYTVYQSKENILRI